MNNAKKLALCALISVSCGGSSHWIINNQTNERIVVGVYTTQGLDTATIIEPHTQMDIATWVIHQIKLLEDDIRKSHRERAYGEFKVGPGAIKKKVIVMRDGNKYNVREG